MGKYEMLVQPVDFDDLKSGHKRAKEGDIIDIKPHPWEWGKRELTDFLVVVVDGLDEKDVVRLRQPHYQGDKDKSEIGHKEVVPVIAKRRFRIPLNKIKTDHFNGLNIDDIKNKNKKYQPLKDQSVTIDATKHKLFKDKKDNLFIGKPKKIGEK